MAFKMKGSPMARNYGHPFKKPTGQDHKGEDHSHSKEESSSKPAESAEPSDKELKTQSILAAREANLAKIKKDKEARYNNTGADRDATFDRFYENPAEAIALLGAAPLMSGVASLAGISHVPTAARLGKTILASEAAIGGLGAKDSLARSAEHKKNKNK